MAIAFDSASRLASNGAGNRTVSHTCASGSVLFAGAFAEDGDNLTSITYPVGGSATSMTQLIKLNHSAGGWLYLYYLSNPDSGTNNLVANFSAGVNGKAILGASYTGGSTSTPTNKNSATASAGSVGVTITMTGGWMVGFAYANGGGPVTSVTNGTLRNTSDNPLMADSNATQTGSFTMTPTGASASFSSGLFAELSPAGAGGSVNSGFFMFM